MESYNSPLNKPVTSSKKLMNPVNNITRSLFFNSDVCKRLGIKCFDNPVACYRCSISSHFATVDCNLQNDTSLDSVKLETYYLEKPHRQQTAQLQLSKLWITQCNQVFIRMSYLSKWHKTIIISFMFSFVVFLYTYIKYKLRSVQNTWTCNPGQGWFVRNLDWGR